MEKREVLTVIIAAVGICMLIGIIRMVTGADVNSGESSLVDPALTTQLTLQAETTNYWDVLRAEQSTAVTLSPDDPNYDPTTTPDPETAGSLVTSYEGTGAGSTIAGIDGVETPGGLDGSLPLLTAVGQTEAAQSTAATTIAETTATTTTTTTTTAVFSLVIP